MNLEFFWTPSRQRLDVRVTLSRRNLRALLLKVADPASSATIVRDVAPGVRLDVRGEPDEVHYRDRPAGQMTLWTEAALQAGSDGDEDARR